MLGGFLEGEGGLSLAGSEASGADGALVETRSGWSWQGRARDCMDSSCRLSPWVLPSLSRVRHDTGPAAWEGWAQRQDPRLVQ